MAKKARFFKVNIQNGHGQYSYITAAQSKAALLNKLEISNTEKLLSMENLGFHATDVAPDEEVRRVKYTANIKNQEVTIIDDPYLMQQFPTETKKAKEIIEEFNNPSC